MLLVVTGPPTAPPGPAPKPLELKPTIRSLKLATLVRRGLTVKTGCQVKCKARAGISVDRATAERLNLRSTQLGSGKGGAKVTIKLTSKARKALRKVLSVRLTVAILATAADGRVGHGRKTLTVRR